MKNKRILRQLVLGSATAFLVSLAIHGESVAADKMSGIPFTDVSSDKWYYDDICYNYQQGIMKGTDSAHFMPEANIARAQFAVIIHRMENTPFVEYDSVFPDVQRQEWYTDAVLWANQNKIVTGFSDTGLFCPSANISREQMATMLYRYAGFIQSDTTEDVEAYLTRFTDANKISGYAREAMEWAVEYGIVSGKYRGRILEPQGNASRAESAAMIKRFENTIKNASASEKYFEQQSPRMNEWYWKESLHQTCDVETYEVTWSKVVGAEGYEVEFSSTDGDMIQWSKRVIHTTEKKYATSMSAIPAKFRIRVRAYATINGQTVYSNWSEEKAVYTEELRNNTQPLYRE